MKKNLKYYATITIISLSVLSPFATAKASYSFGIYTNNNVIYNAYVANSSNTNTINYSRFNTAPIKVNYVSNANYWYNNNYWWITPASGTSQSNRTVAKKKKKKKKKN